MASQSLGSRPDGPLFSSSTDAGHSSEEESLLGHGRRRMRRFWDGFIDWAFQDNILKIAFGMMYAALISTIAEVLFSIQMLMPGDR
jgi:large conductance mechanosensitive channel